MKLAFRLGSIPVTVHGSFLLVVAFLALSSGDGGPPDPAGMIQWVLVVLVGVLLHEMGHALVGRSFGLTPQIDLIGMGGLTSWSAGAKRPLSAGRRIAISLAGPFTGIAIGLATVLFIRVRGGVPLLAIFDIHPREGFPPFTLFARDTPWTALSYDIVVVNAGWGVLNLIPILPMDGGNVLFQSLNALTKGAGERPARIVSCGVAIVIGLGALKIGWIFAAFLAGLFAVQNIQALRAASAHANDAPLRDPLKAGFAALEGGDPGAAVRIARDVLARASSAAVRTDAVRLLAFGYLLSRAWGDLVGLMESPASQAIGDDEMEKFERAARELGRPEEGERIAAVRAKRRAPRV